MEISAIKTSLHTTLPTLPTATATTHSHNRNGSFRWLQEAVEVGEGAPRASTPSAGVSEVDNVAAKKGHVRLLPVRAGVLPEIWGGELDKG